MDQAETAVSGRSAKVGDVIQIAPNTDVREPFWGKLAMVDEVRSWGVKAFVATFEGDAYIRLSYGTFEVIGPALWLPSDIGEDD